MAKQIDPKIGEVLKSYGFGKEAVWDCHGTWVIYHNVLEQVAAQAGIQFEPPLPLETNGAGKSVAICVTGRKDGVAEWSIGEASPANCKNAYPYAMAEKRAKDRVILKLVGLHGLAYSEDEADDFKASAPAPEAPKQAQPALTTTLLPPAIEPNSEAQKLVAKALTQALKKADSVEDLKKWWTDEATQGALKSLPEVLRIELIEAKTLHLEKLKERVTA
jgi:hypothetical protein